MRYPMMGPGGAAGVAGVLFFLVWLLFVAGGIAGYIVFLVAAWRAMKAHESVAASLRLIAQRTAGGGLLPPDAPERPK